MVKESRPPRRLCPTWPAKCREGLAKNNKSVRVFLVSKAIHAPKKNKQLIRQAIASGQFPNLVDRILENKGEIDLFIEDNNA